MRDDLSSEVCFPSTHSGRHRSMMQIRWSTKRNDIQKTSEERHAEPDKTSNTLVCSFCPTARKDNAAHPTSMYRSGDLMPHTKSTHAGKKRAGVTACSCALGRTRERSIRGSSMGKIAVAGKRLSMSCSSHGESWAQVKGHHKGQGRPLPSRGPSCTIVDMQSIHLRGAEWLGWPTKTLSRC